MHNFQSIVIKCTRICTEISKSVSHAFFISNTFISNTRLKLTKNQAKSKQHPEAKLLLFENYSLSSSMLSSKNNWRFSKMYKKQVRLFKRGYMSNHIEHEAENETDAK